MIHHYTYSNSFSEGKPEPERYSELSAQFRFWDETAPCDRKKIMKRLAVGNRPHIENQVINEYMELAEGLDLSSQAYGFGKYQRTGSLLFRSKDDKKTLYLARPLFRPLTVNLVVRQSGLIVPQDELFDLNTFNHFVITGEMKKK